MDDEDKWDREQQHLDDHHYDLMHEEKLANCEHDDFTVKGIDDATYSSLQLEIKCDFCGKLGHIDVLLKELLEKNPLHLITLYDLINVNAAEWGD